MSDELTDPQGDRHALYLGDGHWIDWIIAGDGDDTRVGAVVYHLQPKVEGGICVGSVQWAPNKWQQDHPNDALNRLRWQLHGAADDHLTLSPSLLCSCGDHGFVRNGRWERA